MRKPKRITNADWDPIKDLAAEIANWTIKEDHQRAVYATALLCSRLDTLERKYGHHASILATRAEYTEDTCDKISLLKSAWKVAIHVGDHKNLVLIASSLAECFVEEAESCTETSRWILLLEDSLKKWEDKDEEGELLQLQQRLSRLRVVRRVPKTTKNKDTTRKL